MRIIAGEYRSRRLFTPPDDLVTRPIPDRVKESLFGLLRGNCEGASVFDCFAGTGAIGLEALSRGASRCVFVERDRGAAKMLQSNIDMLGCQDRAEVVIGDALGAGAMARCPRPLDLAFFDPPYPLVREPLGWTRVKDQVTKAIALLSKGGFVVLRLPHPFFHDVMPDGTASPESLRLPTKKPEPAKRKHRKGKGEERFDWRREVERPKKAPDEPTPDAAPDEDEEIAEMPSVESESDAATKVWPSLTLDGARGPETHIYHATAIHLYMREE
jgi:16S rRNA (guanine(966)-N(2))-methyltransferase RsmD